jgi:hypothetical protein
MLTQIESWKRDVWDRQSEVDPDNETHDWRSLALGYFIGLGLSIEHAEESVREASKQGLI